MRKQVAGTGLEDEAEAVAGMEMSCRQGEMLRQMAGGELKTWACVVEEPWQRDMSRGAVSSPFVHQFDRRGPQGFCTFKPSRCSGCMYECILRTLSTCLHSKPW